VSRAFFCFDYFNCLPVNVRLNLSPQWRTRAAAAQANHFNGDVHFGEDRQRVAQRKRDAFEDGANDVCARVIRRQSDKCGACVSRCGVRSPIKYGAHNAPSDPGGAVAASSIKRS